MPKKRRKPKHYAVGEHGDNRVSVVRRTDRDGHYRLVWWVRDALTGRAVRHRKSLGRCTESEAKTAADKLAIALRGGHYAMPAGPRERVTLGAILDRYEQAVTPTKSSGAHDRIVFGLMRELWGDRCDPLTLDRAAWDTFVKRRAAGTLVPPHGRRGVPAKVNTIASDLRTVRAIFGWACQLRAADGEPVLRRHPFAGCRLPKVVEPPARPRLVGAELVALRDASRRVGPLASLAFTLAEETGHRIGAIRQLRWSDIDLGAQTITWRAASDKTRRQHVTPLSAPALEALQVERSRVGAIGSRPLFPSATGGDRPVSVNATRRWWRAIETEAGTVNRPERRGWHSLRRTFADSLRHVALVDAAALGGWSGPQMLLSVYQAADLDTMRAALAGRSAESPEIGANGPPRVTPSVPGRGRSTGQTGR